MLRESVLIIFSDKNIFTAEKEILRIRILIFLKNHFIGI